MWKELGEGGKGGLILDPPTSLMENVHLGSEQAEVPNDPKIIGTKSELFKK